MRHFSEQAWADFVRGINNSERGEMETHLASGCNDCAAERGTWKQLNAMALRESTYAAPESAVRMVKLEFSTQRLKLDQGKPPVLANLVFDTFVKPALAGVRSSVAAAARQMVFEADGFAVDLRFDSAASSERIFLIGQVLDKRIPRAPLEDTVVILWTDKGLAIAETKANAFGEFSLELERQNNLRLSIEVLGHTRIRIPLANLRPEHGPDVAGGPGGN
jgi:hypothetical protein